MLPWKNDLILSQAMYIENLLYDTNMHENNGVTTPMNPSTQLKITPHEPPLDITEYRKIIGKFQYLSLSDPAYLLRLSKLSEFMHHL